MSELKSQLDGITRHVPEAIIKRIDAGVADLAASGVAPGLPVGATAPHFSLPDAFGNVVALDKLLAGGPVVLTFYRGDWCPFCNLQLRALQQSLDQIQSAGATLVAVSAQAPDHASGLVEKHELEFPVLSDLDQSVSEAYKVRFDVTGEIEDLQVNVFHHDPADLNADGRRSLPVSSTFIIGTDGVVRASWVDADWRNRVEPADVVAALQEL